MAFTPVRTLSGAMFPIKTGETSATTLAVGDLLVPVSASGKWTKFAATTTGGRGPLAVAMSAAAAADATCDVCLVTPDVLFKTNKTGTAGSNTVFKHQQRALNATNMNIADSAAIAYSTAVDQGIAQVYAADTSANEYIVFLAPYQLVTTT